MSGGETQRIGLARTFVAPRRLVVLDDVAASLDTVTEHHIAKVLTGALAGRTRIVVAHRASTASRADVVVWLDGGHDPRDRAARAALARARLPRAVRARRARTARTGCTASRPTGARDEPARSAAGRCARCCAPRCAAAAARSRRLVAWSLVAGRARLPLRPARRAGDRRRLPRRRRRDRASPGSGSSRSASSSAPGRRARPSCAWPPSSSRFATSSSTRTVTGALRRSTAPGASADAAGVARLTHQVEIVREAYASVLIVTQGFLVTSVGALLGLFTLLPLVLVLVVPPVVVGLALFFAALPGMAARQRDSILADERHRRRRRRRSPSGLRDVVACGAEEQRRGARRRAHRRAGARDARARPLHRGAHDRRRRSAAGCRSC